MIEALFKKYKIFIIILSFNIIFCINEKDLANNFYISSYHPICAQTCIDFFLKEKTPYMGLHWMVSHNLFLSNRTSLYNDNESDLYIHNLSGLDLNIFNKNNHKLFLSFDLNKSFYYDSQNHGWHQMALIYLIKVRKSNFQIILDSIYDDDWSDKLVNCIYGVNIFHSVFLNIGLNQNLDNNNINYFLTLNFNI